MAFKRLNPGIESWWNGGTVVLREGVTGGGAQTTFLHPYENLDADNIFVLSCDLLFKKQWGKNVQILGSYVTLDL